MVTFKYVFIVLHADNQGEGGTFSCYSLLTRFVRNKKHRPPFNLIRTIQDIQNAYADRLQ